MKTERAFTLIERLVVIATTAILAALLLSALSGATVAGQRTTCVNNLKEVGMAIRMYAEDWAEALPVLAFPNPYPNGVGAYYKQLVKPYLGPKGPAAPTEKVFVCPADRIFSAQVGHAFTSYTFNGYEVGPNAIARITGQKLSAIKVPARAVLAGEVPAFFGGSWHPFVRQDYKDAKNILLYVDGHAANTRIYWDGQNDSDPATYEPPPAYEYCWDGN